MSSPAVASRDNRLAFAGLSLAMLLASFATSSANVALPALQRHFAASFGAVQWIVLAYLLAATSLIVCVGRLGDRFGRRRLLLAGTALFTAASVLGAAAPSLPLLVAARFLQGIGAAAMTALAMALASEQAGARRSGRAMGLIGATSAAGTALGPSLGGVLLAGFGWRAIFLVNLPLGLLAVLLLRSAATARRHATRDAGPFDFAGVALLAASLAAFALAATGSFGPADGLVLIAAAAGVALFLRVERSARSPMIPLGLFRGTDLGAGLAMSALVSSVVMGTLVVGPFFLSLGLGLGPAWVGLLLSAGPVTAALAALPAGRLTDRIGAARASLVGLAAMAVGSLGLTLAPGHGDLFVYLPATLLLTAGYALFQTANNAGVMAAAAADTRGVIAGMLSLARNLGLILGASAIGAVFARAAGSAPIAEAGPQAVAAATRAAFGLAACLALAALVLAGRAIARRGEGRGAHCLRRQAA